MRIINLACKRTNSYLLENSRGWIMIDTDFPDTLHQLTRLLKQHDIKLCEIEHLLITHFHPDHAGIAQDLKNLGVRLILHECQVPFIDNLNAFFKKDNKAGFTDIDSSDNIVVSDVESRKLLKDLGMDGEIIRTPGHSEDSITLIVDGCCAFTGDLPEFALAEAYHNQLVNDSWRAIRDRKITKIYPGHGNPYTIV